jgi:hypothetical protein
MARMNLVRKKDKPLPAANTQQEAYNYPHFRPHYYNLHQFTGPNAGNIATDFMAYDISGQKVRLSDLRGRWVIMETGSLTCPMYAQNVEKMNQLARLFPDMVFLLLYIREAHPGSKIGAHRSMISKIRCARQIHADYYDMRQVWVDDLNGSVHHQYGAFPNMIYLIDPSGRVVYRSDWNRPEELYEVLENRNQVIYNDHSPPPIPAPWIAIPTFMKGGWDAVLDVLVSVPGLMKLWFLESWLT